MYTEARYIFWKCILYMKEEWGSSSGGKNRLSVTIGNPLCDTCVALPSSMWRQEETSHMSSEGTGRSCVGKWCCVREREMAQETNNMWKQKGNMLGENIKSAQHQSVACHCIIVYNLRCICEAKKQTVQPETPCCSEQRCAGLGIYAAVKLFHTLCHAVILYCL